jgi:hypothetical protein
LAAKPRTRLARCGSGKREAKRTGFARKDGQLRNGSDMDTEQTMRAVAACHEKLAQRVEHYSVGGRPSSDTPP